MHSSTGQHGGDLNTDTITIIGATLDLQEKVVRQVSTALVDFPACFPPADMVRAGHDTDQRRLHALDRQQTRLRDPPKDLCDGSQQGARIRRSRGSYFRCYRSEEQSWIRYCDLTELGCEGWRREDDDGQEDRWDIFGQTGSRSCNSTELAHELTIAAPSSVFFSILAVRLSSEHEPWMCD